MTLNMAATLSLLSLLMTPPSARSAALSVEGQLSSGLEINDNYQLSPVSRGTVNTLSLAGHLQAARRTENAQTEFELGLIGLALQGPDVQNRVDARLVASHSVNDALNLWRVGAEFEQDDTFDTLLGTADLTLGRLRRQTGRARAEWSHALSERSTAQTRLTLSKTTYDQTASGAVDYRDAAVSAGGSYRLSEYDTLDLTLAASGYRAADGSTTARTGSVGASWSRVLSERSIATLALGRFRSRTEAQQQVLACPVPVSFCESGQVAYEVAVARGESSGNGWLYSAQFEHQASERTKILASAQRQVAPSGVGSVVLSDTAKATLNRALSPTLQASADVALSSSRYPDSAGGRRPRFSNLRLGLSRALAGNLKFDAFVATGGVSDGSAATARSNRAGVALNYSLASFDARR